ncbi:MAG: YjfA family protein [Actinobacteria bacterium]|nr:YjfA family protein [Actinomycetota bacterium]MCA1721173.1 YjfA family protein [Actinomycetota bacterium]
MNTTFQRTPSPSASDSISAGPTATHSPARLRRRVGAIATVASGLIATTVGLASPALAASCYSGSCRGADPNSSSCASDARTILANEYQAENNASFRVEVRYSPSCRSAWGRLIVYSGNNVGFGLSAWTPNTPSLGAVGHSGNTTWTSMVDGVPPDCAGVQFYTNGQWKRWYSIGCA